MLEKTPQLASEQKPNDGGWHNDRLIREANHRLNQKGKRGKRAKIKRSGKNLALQFSFNGKQHQKGINITVSPKGINEAEGLAELVTAQLTGGMFTWDWFNKLIGKSENISNKKELTGKQMLEEYKIHFFKEREQNKHQKSSWKQLSGKLELVLENCHKPIDLQTVKKIIELSKNNSQIRKTTLNGLINFLNFFGLSEYNNLIDHYKKNNNPKSQKRTVPSDEEIEYIYQTGFNPGVSTAKKWLYRFSQWQFLYGLLAVYGLRIHEAWSIANWDTPVTLKNGDWVTLFDPNDNKSEQQYKGQKKIIKAVLDSTNTDHILCIKHDTKTGYRMAIPLSPEGHNWLKEFNLLQPLNLPDIPNPLKRMGKHEEVCNCTRDTNSWFKRKKYGFTAHALRHAYNHRGHRLGINLTVLCQSLGHSMQMNNTTYLNTMSHEVKLESMISEISKDKEKRSKIELLEQENKLLKIKIEELENEIKYLVIILEKGRT